ncbi:MAG TPA: cell division protein SepF [Alphaproteobacteria bacterium]|nr:cell division protein SepF [Alphaproteobacteria bacterium]
MAGFFSKIKSSFKGKDFDDEDVMEHGGGDEYVELDTSKGSDGGQKIIVKPFVLDDFTDIKPILDSLREGNTICLVNIRPLKEKDLIELKRAINKLKKTTDAIEGDIAGFSDDYIVITPSFAEIYRSKGGAANIQAAEASEEDQ